MLKEEKMRKIRNREHWREKDASKRGRDGGGERER